MRPDNESEPLAEWRTEGREQLADCRVFTVDRRRMRRSSDPELVSDFFVIRSPDWVNVIALTEQDELVLIEQWRHGVAHITLEIPGGMVDPGESPHRAAVRELEEETGFRADRWLHMGWVEPNPAIQENRCHTFLALGARQATAPHFDGTEECRLVLRPYSEAADLVASGRIAHSLVIAALHWERLRRAGVVVPRDPETAIAEQSSETA